MSHDGDTPPGGLVAAILAGLALRRHGGRPPEPESAHWPEAPRAGPGHETGDVDVRKTGLVMAGLMVSALTAIGLMFGLMHLYAASQRRALPALTPQQTARLTPPPPNLQADPYGDLARARAAEQAKLDGYAITDPTSGRARIPLDRAMRLTVGRALDP